MEQILEDRTKTIITYKVKKIIEKELGIDTFSLDDDFIDDLLCNADEQVHIVLRAESSFNIKNFSTDEIEDITTPRELIEGIWCRI